MLAEQKSYTGLIAISALCGYVRAATVVNQNLVLSEHCKASRLPAALGLGMCVKGAFVITIGQFLGNYICTEIRTVRTLKRNFL